MTSFRIGAALVFCLAASACASGPKLSSVENTLPKPDQAQGRIWFYRTALMGAAIQPSIMVNNQKVGSCAPGGVFYKDYPAGDYQASVETEVARKLTFNVASGDEKYIRCYISIGVFVGHANLELVDPAEAKSEIKDLSYTAK